MKRQTEALEYFRRALGLNARSVTALINLANAEADAETAEQMYKKALDISPTTSMPASTLPTCSTDRDVCTKRWKNTGRPSFWLPNAPKSATIWELSKRLR